MSNVIVCHGADAFSAILTTMSGIVAVGCLTLTLLILYHSCTQSSSIAKFFQYFESITLILLCICPFIELSLSIMCQFNATRELLSLLQGINMTIYCLSQLSLCCLLTGRLYFILNRTRYNYSQSIYTSFYVLTFVNSLLILIAWLLFVIFSTNDFNFVSLCGSIITCVLFECIALLLLFSKSLIKIEIMTHKFNCKVSSHSGHGTPVTVASADKISGSEMDDKTELHETSTHDVNTCTNKREIPKHILLCNCQCEDCFVNTDDKSIGATASKTATEVKKSGIITTVTKCIVLLTTIFVSSIFYAVFVLGRVTGEDDSLRRKFVYFHRFLYTVLCFISILCLGLQMQFSHRWYYKFCKNFDDFCRKCVVNYAMKQLN